MNKARQKTPEKQDGQNESQQPGGKRPVSNRPHGCFISFHKLQWSRKLSRDSYLRLNKCQGNPAVLRWNLWTGPKYLPLKRRFPADSTCCFDPGAANACNLQADCRSNENIF